MHRNPSTPLNTTPVNHATLVRWQQELRQIARNPRLSRRAAAALLDIADEVDETIVRALYHATALDAAEQDKP